jgi:hypothetical protein
MYGVPQGTPGPLIYREITDCNCDLFVVERRTSKIDLHSRNVLAFERQLGTLNAGVHPSRRGVIEHSRNLDPMLTGGSVIRRDQMDAGRAGVASYVSQRSEISSVAQHPIEDIVPSIIPSTPRRVSPIPHQAV